MKRNCVVNQCCGCCCLCPVRQGASAPYSVWCCASVTRSLGWWVLILRLAIRVGDILSIAQGKGATPAQGTGYVEMLLQVRECAVSRLERLTQIRCNQPRWLKAGTCTLWCVVVQCCGCHRLRPALRNQLHSGFAAQMRSVVSRHQYAPLSLSCISGSNLITCCVACLM